MIHLVNAVTRSESNKAEDTPMSAMPAINKINASKIVLLQAKDEMLHKLRKQVVPVSEHKVDDLNQKACIIEKNASCTTIRGWETNFGNN